MKSFPVEIVDPVFTEAPDYSSIDKFFLKFIRDERDLPFIYLTIKISAVMVPVGLLLYLPFINAWTWWAVSLLYFFLNNFVYKGPFGLMLHCTSHRPWFKKEYRIVNQYLPWFVGLFFGQSPKTYALHHLGMHHRENNLEEDLSSTMNYQRDSLKDFFKYFVEFFFNGILSLAGYFNKRNQRMLAFKVLRGELFFIGLCVGLSFVSWTATFMVFILPLLMSRLVMMAGNWAQHSFIDPQDPGNHYKNSISCVNVPYNKKCWNDGYHISHHIMPSMHWTKHPEHLKNNLSEYSENKALVFEGMDYLFVWFNLMRKDYDVLADHLVNINGMFKNKEEAIEIMKSRTRKLAINKPDLSKLEVAA